MKGVTSPVARILAEGMQAHVGIDAVGYGGIVTYVPLGTPGGIPFGISGAGNGGGGRDGIMGGIYPSAQFPMSVGTVISNSCASLHDGAHCRIGVMAAVHRQYDFRREQEIGETLEVPFKDVFLKVYLLHVRPGQGLHIVGGREMEIYLFLLFVLQTLLGLAFIKARTLVLFWRKGNLLFLYGRPVLYCVFRNLALCIGAE